MKIYIFLLILLLIYSCHQKEYIQKPHPFIERQTMEDIIFDLVIYRDVYNNYANDSIKKKNTNIDKLILDKYKISDSIFSINNRYYFYRTDIYKEILDKIVYRLENMKNEDTINKKDTLVHFRENE